EVATGRTAHCVGKPEPGLFAEVLRRAGPSDGRVVVIGDSPDYDMVPAHRLGATGVLVLTGLTDAAAAQRATGEAVPDHVIESLDQLFALPELRGV
ncbi:MAG: TIGR01458 family HAD-type hydrolase, partial [Chloroflexi bacterium]|nr:TIGR01458 family HAD-type hydrolase [Chloroflexota bacterium]